MSRLLLGNIEPGTSDEEIAAFLEKYGFPRSTTSNTRKAMARSLPCC